MQGIDNKYISNAIDELVNLLGIKEDISTMVTYSPLNTRNVKLFIENIANYLGLPVVINLSYVPANYQARNTNSGFKSSALATTDRAGRGTQGITAQVSIPSYLPLYGTAALQGFPINVKISDNCLKHRETFVAIMAHELSHIVLHSLWHREKDNDYYIDLTAMILGFSATMLSGRKTVETREKFMSTETLTTTYGYLPDEQFYFAFNKISEILNKNITLKKKLLKKLPTYRKQFSSYKKEFLKFNKFVEYLDKNQRKRIRREDAAVIVSFHQVDYTERFAEVIRSNEGKLKEINDYCAGLTHYTQPRRNSLQKLSKEIDTLISDLKGEFNLLNKDVNTLGKYVGFLYKWKINRQFIKGD